MYANELRSERFIALYRGAHMDWSADEAARIGRAYWHGGIEAAERAIFRICDAESAIDRLAERGWGYYLDLKIARRLTSGALPYAA